jgi:hypothetical protein
MSTPLPPPDPANVAPRTTGSGSVAGAIVVCAAIGSIAGGLSGLVWGGIGGRIAMRIVLLTSDHRVRGITSDDGFRIGTISAATIFLLIFTTILGAMAGFASGLIRMVTAGPTWAVAIGSAVASASVGGAAIVHTDGVDFRFLEPLWLTVGLFVLIPGLWGASVVFITERILRSPSVTGLPAQIHRRYTGAVGWLALVAVTSLGVRDLVADIGALA